MKLVFLMSLLGAMTTPVHAGAVCESGLKAYQATLYPLQRQYCISCHGGSGPGIGHSVADAAQAYQVTRGLVDFVDIESSTLMVKFRAQHWLSYGGAAIPLTPEQVHQAIQDWSDQGESACPSSMAFTSQAIALPNPLPTRASGQFTTMTWDPGESNASLVGCHFQIDAQEFTAAQGSIPASYRLKSPRLGCLTQSLHIHGLWVPVSGSVQAYENEFSQIDADVPSVANLQSLNILSSGEGIFIQRKTSGDTLSVLLEQFSVK